MRTCKQRGQAIAELAILLPLLVLIVLGCLDLGRVFLVWLALSNGTREGARYAASYPGAPSATVVAVARDDMAEQGLARDRIRVLVTSAAPGERVGGQPVTVTAQCSVTLVTTCLFSGQPVAVSASTAMIILPGGQ